MLHHLFVSLTVLGCIYAFDPCQPGNHLNLTNAESRSTGYIMPNGQIACCDSRLDEDWYRIYSTTGTDMPTTCPPSNACGTIGPIWMNDTIPPVDGNPHFKKAVAHALGDCFFSEITIKVKNCGTYRVYHLPQAPLCPAGYCFGDQTPSQNIGTWCTPDTTTTTTTTTVSSTSKPSMASTGENQPPESGGTSEKMPRHPDHAEMPVFWIVAVSLLAVTLIIVTVILLILLKKKRQLIYRSSCRTSPEPHISKQDRTGSLSPPPYTSKPDLTVYNFEDNNTSVYTVGMPPAYIFQSERKVPIP